jgi:hypothetical protein
MRGDDWIEDLGSQRLKARQSAGLVGPMSRE